MSLETADTGSRWMVITVAGRVADRADGSVLETHYTADGVKSESGPARRIVTDCSPKKRAVVFLQFNGEG